MRPQDSGRVMLREQRRAWRGMGGRRRATRKVKTTYGRHQRLRDWHALVAEWQSAGGAS